MRKITLLAAAIAVSAASCTSKAGSDIAAAASDTMPAAASVAEIAVTDTIDSLYTARVDANGDVVVTFDQGHCKKLLALFGGMPMKGVDGKVLNVPGKVVQLATGNAGNNVNPFLMMRTQDGKVAIFSIMDAMIEGDMRSSGAMWATAAGSQSQAQEITGATSVKMKCEEDGCMLTAVMADGSTVAVAENMLSGTFIVNDGDAKGFEMILGNDWSMQVVEHGKGTYGTLRLLKARRVEEGPISDFMAVLDDGTELGFSLLENELGEGDMYKITFTQCPSGFPIAIGKTLPLDVKAFGESLIWQINKNKEMKRNILIAMLCLTLCFPACSGNKASNAAVASEASPAGSASVADSQARQLAASAQHGGVKTNLYSAAITGSGDVEITFNKEMCAKLVQMLGDNMICDLPEGNKVENIGGKAVQLRETNFGGDVNPFLVVRTQDGKVAILSIIDAITMGTLNSSGPLAGIEGATGFKEKIGEYVKVMAITPQGDKELLSSTFIASNGYSLMVSANACYCIMGLSRDWNIAFFPEADCETPFKAHGTFQPAGSGFDVLDDDMRFVAHLPGGTVHFTASYKNHFQSGEKLYITFTKAYNGFPLPLNKPIRALTGDEKW